MSRWFMMSLPRSSVMRLRISSRELQMCKYFLKYWHVFYKKWYTLGNPHANYG